MQYQQEHNSQKESIQSITWSDIEVVIWRSFLFQTDSMHPSYLIIIVEKVVHLFIIEIKCK